MKAQCCRCNFHATTESTLSHSRKRLSMAFPAMHTPPCRVMTRFACHCIGTSEATISSRLRRSGRILRASVLPFVPAIYTSKAITRAMSHCKTHSESFAVRVGTASFSHSAHCWKMTFQLVMLKGTISYPGIVSSYRTARIPLSIADMTGPEAGRPKISLKSWTHSALTSWWSHPTHKLMESAAVVQTGLGGTRSCTA